MNIYFHWKYHFLKFWAILAKSAVIYRGEGVDIAKIGCNIGIGEFLELFKYGLRFSITLLVAEILAVKETPLFSEFSPFFGIMNQLVAVQNLQNSPKRRYFIPFTIV